MIITNAPISKISLSNILQSNVKYLTEEEKKKKHQSDIENRTGKQSTRKKQEVLKGLEWEKYIR